MRHSCKPSIAVVGAGLIGMRHARMIAGNNDCELAAIIDPRHETRSLAKELGCAWHADINEMNETWCDGVIIATPNHSHKDIALRCLDFRLPCLIEKPITDDIESGTFLVEAFTSADVPLLIGHHRRYHPFVAETRKLLASGVIGSAVCASIVWAVKKPDGYFTDGAWRLGADGGPIMINLVHEVDLMRCIFGEFEEVSAISSNKQRNGPVEDTAGVVVRFESGLIATIVVSDAALTPWSFEGACGENPNIAETGVSSWKVGCTNGAFEFPLLKSWHYNGNGDWSKPLQTEEYSTYAVQPLKEQLNHFIELVNGTVQEPIVSGQQGLNTLIATKAILHSIKKGKSVLVSEFGAGARSSTTSDISKDNPH